MRKSTNNSHIHSPSLYIQQILKFYQEKLVNKGIKIISTGVNQYQKNQWSQSYPIDGYLQTKKKLIVIEVQTSKKLVSREVKKIIHQKFRPLSKKMETIGIIESYKGFDESAVKDTSFEDYPIILTSRNDMVACNNRARWDKFIETCYFWLEFKIDRDSKEKKPENDLDFEMLAFVLSGSVRLKIYAYLLVNQRAYAYEIAQHEKLKISSVLRTLKDLEKEKVIECLSPESKRRRIFTLTEEALNLKEEVMRRL